MSAPAPAKPREFWIELYSTGAMDVWKFEPEDYKPAEKIRIREVTDPDPLTAIIEENKRLSEDRDELVREIVEFMRSYSNGDYPIIRSNGFFADQIAKRFGG